MADFNGQSLPAEAAQDLEEAARTVESDGSGAGFADGVDLKRAIQKAISLGDLTLYTSAFFKSQGSIIGIISYTGSSDNAGQGRLLIIPRPDDPGPLSAPPPRRPRPGDLAHLSQTSRPRLASLIRNS